MIFSRPLVVFAILCYVLIISINWNIVQLNVSSQDIVPITKGFYVFINSPVESMLLGMLFLMNLTSPFVIFLLHHLLHLILCPLLRFVPLFPLLQSFLFLPLHYLLHQLPLHRHLHLSLHFNLNPLLHQHLILFHSLLEPLLCPLPLHLLSTLHKIFLMFQNWLVLFLMLFQDITFIGNPRTLTLKLW